MSVVSPKKIELWPIDRLRPYAQNARIHPPEQIEKIAKSIVAYGFNNPLLVDTADGIVAGHGRLEAANSLGLAEVPVIVLDHLTDSQRRAYILADNRLGELAQWDDEILSSELRALSAEGFDLDPIGWEDDEIEALGEDLEDFIDEELSAAEDDAKDTAEIVLTFELNEHAELTDKIQALRRRWKLDSAEEVISHLVRGAA